MTEHEFENEMDRIATCLELPDGVSDELYQRYRSLTPSTWKRVVSLVLERVKGPPRVAHFVEAVKDALRTGTTEKPADLGCSECTGGFKFVKVTARDGKEYSAVDPCPKCNADQYIPNRGETA